MGTDRRGTAQLATVAETEAFGARLAAELTGGDLVILDGPLGAGKTALTRGIATGLGVRGRVSSPTFVIARVHRGTGDGPDLVHVDAYRLTDAADPLGELDALDLDAELRDAVVVVEWGRGLVESLTDRHLLVRLTRDDASEVRTAVWAWSDAADPGR